MSCANHFFFSRPQPCTHKNNHMTTGFKNTRVQIKQGRARQKHRGSSITMLSWEKKVHELVFKHLKQLVQRMEPAEPLITVIYKPDSTLMRRQKLAALSFSRLFLFSPPSTILFHLCAPFPHLCPSITSCCVFFLLLLALTRFQRPSYFLLCLSVNST